MRLFRRKDAAPPERKSASFMLGMGSYRSGFSGADFDRYANEGYAANAVAHACIDKIASSIASVDLQVYKKGNGGKLDKLEDHPLLTLMENPNPAQSGKEFARYLVSYYLTGGNAYVYGNGIDPNRKGKPPGELQLFNPGKVKVEPGDSYFPLAYEYRPDASKKYTYPVDQVTGKSAVLQFKTFNPLSPWTGLPPMLAAAFGIDIFNAGQKWNKKLLDNEARPSGALVMKNADGTTGTLSDDQYRRLQEQIDTQFTGTNNAGRPLLLEGGLDWRELSINPKDADFLNGKHSAARDIGLVFGVPPQLIGIPGDSTFANYEQATLSFWTETVLPLLCWILEGFNRWLSPLYGEGIYLWYDEDTIPALEPRRAQKATRINAATYMTVNERRTAMGLDEIDGGDVILVPATNVPLDMVGAVSLAEPGSEADPKPKPGDEAPEPEEGEE